MTGAMIELKGVEFAYPAAKFRLEVDALSVAPRERVALVGPSGSGKTTLVHLMAGILLPSKGSVAIDGCELNALDERSRRRRRITSIGMVFQEFELLNYLSALDNVLLPHFVSGALRADDSTRARALELLRSMGIETLLDRGPGRLSQGERQRVALARALVTQPRILLCDEPTGNLDVETAGRALDLLLEQTAACSATLVMVTHDAAALSRFDRVLDMKRLMESRG